MMIDEIEENNFFKSTMCTEKQQSKKIKTNYTTRQAYLLQHSYSQISVEQGPKFSQTIQQHNLILQHSYSKAPVELGPKFGQILQLDKPTHYGTATARLQWS